MRSYVPSIKPVLQFCLSIITACFVCPGAQADMDPPSIAYERVVEHYVVDADLKADNLWEVLVRIETMHGVEFHAQREFTYSKTYQDIKVLEAYTLQADGTRIPVPPSAIRERFNTVDSNSLSDLVTLVVVFPEVKVGSRLYWKVHTRIHTPAYPGHFKAINRLPVIVKTEYAEFHLDHDARVPMQVAARGLDGGQLPDQGDGRKRYRYTGNYLDPMTWHDAQVSHGDIAPHFIASTFAGWGELGQAYYQRARLPETLPAGIVALAEEVTRGLSSQRDQAQAIHQWVIRNIRYLSLSIDDGGLVPRPLESILANRYGDCKDQARLIQALLKARDIDSEPVLINRGTSYSLPELAVHSPLNHVITYVPALDVYVDTTRAMAPFGDLDSGLMGKPAILARSGTVVRTPLASGRLNRSMTFTRMRMDKDGTIHGEGEARLSGWPGIEARENKDASPERLVRDRLQSYRLTGSGKIVTSDPRDLLQPYEETFRFSLDPMSNMPGRGAFSIPAGLAPMSVNALSVVVWPEKLDTPAVCTSRSIVEDTVLQLPRSIRIRHIPNPARYRDGVIDYQSSYRLQGRVLHVKRTLDITRATAVCGQEEHERWKSFQAVLRKDLRSQVVYE